MHWNHCDFWCNIKNYTYGVNYFTWYVIGVKINFGMNRWNSQKAHLRHLLNLYDKGYLYEQYRRNSSFRSFQILAWTTTPPPVNPYSSLKNCHKRKGEDLIFWLYLFEIWLRISVRKFALWGFNALYTLPFFIVNVLNSFEK